MQEYIVYLGFLALFLLGAGEAKRPLVYMSRPVPAQDLTIKSEDPNVPAACPEAKLCAGMWVSCRCTADNICDDMSCQDRLVARYCFCAYREKP